MRKMRVAVTAWTEEQVQNILLYGKCRICGEPREKFMIDKTTDGKRVVTAGIICPNGHGQ